MAVEYEIGTREEVGASNRTTLLKLLMIVPVMLAFCASLVPLYRQICEVLGISASRTVAGNTQVDTSRRVSVDFVAHRNSGFAWQFEPLDRNLSIHPGAVVTMHYRVTNTLPVASTGRAVPSFSPVEAGLYINKIACFCFSSQTLGPGETRDMPVTFYVDPNMPKAIESIAMSYTFLEVPDRGRT